MRKPTITLTENGDDGCFRDHIYKYQSKSEKEECISGSNSKMEVMIEQKKTIFAYRFSLTTLSGLESLQILLQWGGIAAFL